MFGLNPWVILAAVLFLGGFGVTCYEKGSTNGANSQKVVDQQEVDKANAKIAANKVEADRLLRESKDNVIKVQDERDAFKNKLTGEHNANREKTDALSRVYSAYGLRFAAAENQRSGAGCENGLPKTSDSAKPAAAPICQLSDSVTKSLRGIAYDADILRDNYTLCRDYALGVK
jgi:hypothetical protein